MQEKEASSYGSTSGSSSLNSSYRNENDQADDGTMAALSEPLDRLKLEEDEVAYTNNSHWTSILEGVIFPVSLVAQHGRWCRC